VSVRTRVGNTWARLRYPRLAPSFSVFSHLTGLERVELFRLASRPGLQHVVEIGSYLGASALALAEGLQAGGSTHGRVHCIDTWGNFGMAEGPRDTFEQFVQNTAPHASRIVPVRGWSTEVAARLIASIGRIDLLFVDGDHSYDGVLADWRVFGPAMAPGGVMAFHDVGWAEGVQRVVAEHVRPRVVAEGGPSNLWWGRLPG
jgi:predicted O-methyltransferase YrrM